MSIRVTSEVFDCPRLQDHSEVLVMLALADRADDAGVCWPSIDELSRKARQSERNVRYVLRRLEEAGALVVQVSRGRGRASKYFIQRAWLRIGTCEGTTLEKGQPLPLFCEQKGAKKTCKRGKENLQKGQHVAPHTSGNHQENRQVAIARAREAEPGQPTGELDLLPPEEHERVSRLAVLIEDSSEARNVGSARRRSVIAQRCAIDGGEFVEELITWICTSGHPDVQRIRRDLARFEDGLIPHEAGRDRLTWAERIRKREGRQHPEGFAGVG